MIKQIGNEECRIAAELAVLLWPGDEIDEVEKDLKEYINSNAGAIFIYLDDSMPVGFAQCGLKNDYVEGTESTPVGYLEGILVKAEHQKRGIARKLLKECEEWAKGQGCIEFASDCELNNFESLKFHLRVGFREANRIICFTKKLWASSGVGSIAAMKVFDMFHGKWQLKRHPKNIASLYFLNKIVSEYTEGKYTLIESYPNTAYDDGTLGDIFLFAN